MNYVILFNYCPLMIRCGPPALPAASRHSGLDPTLAKAGRSSVCLLYPPQVLCTCSPLCLASNSSAGLIPSSFSHPHPLMKPSQATLLKIAPQYFLSLPSCFIFSNVPVPICTVYRLCLLSVSLPWNGCPGGHTERETRPGCRVEC